MALANSINNNITSNNLNGRTIKFGAQQRFLVLRPEKVLGRTANSRFCNISPIRNSCGRVQEHVVREECKIEFLSFQAEIIFSMQNELRELFWDSGSFEGLLFANLGGPLGTGGGPSSVTLRVAFWELYLCYIPDGKLSRGAS